MFYYFFLLFKNYIIVAQLQLYALSPHHPVLLIKKKQKLDYEKFCM